MHLSIGAETSYNIVTKRKIGHFFCGTSLLNEGGSYGYVIAYGFAGILADGIGNGARIGVKNIFR